MPSLTFNRADIETKLGDTFERMDDIRTEWMANNPGRTFHYSYSKEYIRLFQTADTYTRLLGRKGTDIQFAPR